jgi:hypothetical protein
MDEDGEGGKEGGRKSCEGMKAWVKVVGVVVWLWDSKTFAWLGRLAS